MLGNYYDLYKCQWIWINQLTWKRWWYDWTASFETCCNFYPTILRMVIYKKKDYLFQLVSVAVSTCRKEVQNKRKQFPLVKNFFLPEQSLSQINLIPLFSVKVFPCRKKCLNKRKRFPQDRKSVSTRRNEKFVEKYIFAKQKIPFTSTSILKIEKN